MMAVSKKNILITGASGLIGARLTNLLIARGHSVSHLGRSKKSGKINSFTWDVNAQTIDTHAFDNVDAIIHLAGAGVAEKRWTPKRKREILESRTLSTKLLYETLRSRIHQVKTVVSASAIGYYGFDRPEVFTEKSPPGNDFLADVTKAWENEAEHIRSLNIRLVLIRIGIALSKEGGALAQMMKPVEYFVGAPLGSGDQYQSWIHIDDLCNLFIKSVEDEAMQGAYNGVAPNPVTNRDMVRAIANALHRPMFLPAVPEFVLKLILGEMSSIVIKGSRVSSEKTESTGFVFTFRTIDEAVKNLLIKA